MRKETRILHCCEVRWTTHVVPGAVLWWTERSCAQRWVSDWSQYGNLRGVPLTAHDSSLAALHMIVTYYHDVLERFGFMRAWSGVSQSQAM